MNYLNILKGLFSNYEAQNEISLPTKQIRLSIDGKNDVPTRDILDTASLELVLLDSDLKLQDLFDTSNVEHDNFNPYAALHYPTDWKLIELTADVDGTLALIFINTKPSNHQLDDQDRAIDLKDNGDGTMTLDFINTQPSNQSSAVNSEFEIVPFGSLSERLFFLLDCKAFDRQYVITQEFCAETGNYVTDILQIQDGRKKILFSSDGIGEGGQSPFWRTKVYATPGPVPQRPLQH